MPEGKIHFSLEYIDFALMLSGSSFTVGISDEESCNHAVESCHIMAAIP